MSNNIKELVEEVWIVGAGLMGKEYAKVLKNMNVKLKLIGRNQENANKVSAELGIPVYCGGISNYLENSTYIPSNVIVAVNLEELATTTMTLLKAGIKSILVEKPAGLYTNDIKNIVLMAEKEKAEVFVGYNRRFYSSVLKAREIIANDSGVKSIHFEFTEWSHTISKLQKPKKVLEKWFMGNSTHVIDLAFYLSGRPKEFSSFKSGSINWHPDGSIFVGSGVTEKNVLFSYHANWEAPGRWGLEVLTSKHRLIFKPLEELHIQKIGSIEITKYDLEDKIDKEYKPGLYRQVNAFLNKDGKKGLLPINEHFINFTEIFTKMLMGVNE
ncbi:predicted dehydrogenase [Bacillus oleivorans]|uniref:Predicted dehydrogenase n=1 Tax=Bacillus oleivorans TaxID=1448271 RepID=A0A285CZ77_9BACI|nr:Gfo/Idh/MocA family oxidoreductase [Bacillus oleivorans]SNX72877.1 predicted dehydrogenase [Bacillus oleivorans]